MDYLFDLLRHVQAVRAWADSTGAVVNIDVTTLKMAVIFSNGVRIALNPRFMIRTPEGPAYTSSFASKCRFVGWPPYDMKRWPAATGKTAFKDHCLQFGLRTPALWSSRSEIDSSFLIKPIKGSWGRGIKGPFSRDDIPHMVMNNLVGAGQDMLIEQFIEGKSAKVWYWGEVPVAIHEALLPTIRGDGRRTIGQILNEPRGSFDRKFNVPLRREYLQWQGIDPDSILPDGQEVPIEFLLASPYDSSNLNEPQRLDLLPESVQMQLEQVGPRLVESIPSSIRPHTFYTLDIVIDRQNLVWLLEMNCHPVVHPALYPHILNDLKSLAVSARPTTQ